MERLAFEAPEFGERAAAHVALNRRLKRGMPASSADRQLALRIMAWACEAEAETVAPEDVKNYRTFCGNQWVDEAHWRTGFDLALGIWKQGYEDHCKKRAAF
jgi:hypothetical protein